MSNPDLLEKAKEKLSPEALRSLEAMPPALVNLLMICGGDVTDAIRTSAAQGSTVEEAIGAAIGSCIAAASNAGMTHGQFMKLVVEILVEAEKMSLLEGGSS